MNKYAFAKKVFREALRAEYPLHRQGAFDFPSEEEWLEQEWKLFVKNNPKLVGLKWDPKNRDWVHNYRGGMVRVIL